MNIEEVYDKLCEINQLKHIGLIVQKTIQNIQGLHLLR